MEELDSFISKRFEPPGSKFVGDSFMAGIGCYVGEVIARTIGGRWNNSGNCEINDVGAVQAISLVQKVVKRFKNGSVDSLSFYYTTILKYSDAKSQ